MGHRLGINVSATTPAHPTPLEDVTLLLREATKELELGEMLMAPHFSVVQAMSGVSIMDPKMDTGLAVLSAQERGKISKDSIKSKDSWTITEICAICDGLLALEIQWLAGNLAAQTVFTCVYLHGIELVSSGIMKAILRGFLWQMSFARSIIMKEQIFFEEDFYVDMSGFELEPELDPNEDDPSKVLDTLVTDIQNIADHDDPVATLHTLDATISCESPKSLKNDLAMLLCRTKYLQLLAKIFHGIKTAHFEHAIEYIPCAKTALEEIFSTPSSVNVDSAFDHLINRKLFSQYPAKQTEQSTHAETMKLWPSILNQIMIACQLPQTENSQTIMGAAESFSVTQVHSNILSRSILHAVLFQDNMLIGKQTFLASVRGIVSATMVYPYIETFSPRMKDILTHLNMRCTEAFEYNLNIFCFNQSRQRRRLAKAIQMWELLQQEAESLDQELQTALFGAETSQFYFTRWIYLQKLHALILFYSMGFKLGLYSINEYPMIFWYLTELHNVRANCVQAIRTLRGDTVDLQMEALSLSFSTQQSIDCQLYSECYADEAKRLLSSALLDLSVALRTLGYLTIVDFHGAYSESAHYTHRFNVMTMLGSPQFLLVDDYTSYVSKDICQVTDLIQKSTLSFELAKGKFDAVVKGETPFLVTDAFKTEARELTKVCISNLISIKAISWKDLQTKSQADLPSIISNQRRELFEFKYHSTFPSLIRIL
ncbi:hypothetical protein BASA61_008006 [Batrachochytrium salamandrivorans]|nr:hypothetical protein BASA62_008726 [Batrachochytrium salamandrivorans]KAH6575150.1 hypothetical protein BASA60_005171 [Batrachochytrium salamandrivorans]KAH6583389.1 hypothetical protein BASA61_008006 [Batrachochytrium salamandrivorans]KAH9268896.1 hypothetical protein BASA83_009029 [Batrachochytrium salamandrivorans]